MKLTSKLFLLVVLFPFSNAFSQDIDLNKYHFRYQKYKGYTVQFGLNNSSNQNYRTWSEKVQNQNSFINSASIGNALNVAPRYFYFINTDALQQTSNWEFKEQFNVSIGIKDNVERDKVKYNSIRSKTELNMGQTSRFYHGQQFKYLQWNTQINFNHNSSRMNDPNVEQDKNMNRDLGASANLQIGQGNGRLEYVSDAVLAMFIVKDLQKSNGMSFDSDQIEGLSKSITYIKRQRYLDYRFALIDQLHMLDSAIDVNSSLSQRDIDYFTTINDNWLYANAISRNSGKRFSYYLDLDAGINSVLDKSENSPIGIKETNYYISNRLIQDYFVAAVLDYVVSKQRSLNRQYSKGLNISSGIQLHADGYWNYSGISPFPDPIPESTQYLDDYWVNSITAYWETLYQPNSRTYFISRISSGINQQSRLSNLRTDQSYHRSFLINPSIGYLLNFYKWLSPHLNLRASLNVTATHSYGKTESEFGLSVIDNRTRLSHYLSAGVRYQLF